MHPSLIIMAAIILIIVILNFFFHMRRISKNSKRKSKGRNHKTFNEAERAQFRAREIARRQELEQEAALERVNLRNSTLSYYEYVRQKYAKKEALERLGIKVEDGQLDNTVVIPPEDAKYMDVRDDIYIYDTPDTPDKNKE